mgnify:CR=1 FL=1
MRVVANTFAVLVLAYVGLVVALRPWHHDWGTSRLESEAPLIGDEFAPNRTRVNVTEAGWQPTPEGLQPAYGNVMGWSYMLAAMRVWLDHGIAMRPSMVS